MDGLGTRILGITAALIGNTVIGVSQFLQKHALNRLQAEQKNVPRYKDLQWIFGLSLSIIGELTGNMVALSYTSTAVVAPLGAIAIIVSGVLATRFLGEKITKRNRRGYILLILGVFLILFVAPKQANALTAEELIDNMSTMTFRIYMSLTISIGVLLIWDLRSEKNQRLYKFILVASIIGSVTVMCSKAISVFVRLTVEGNSQFAGLLPYLLIFLLVTTAVGQEYYKQQAIGKFDASKFWPMFFASYNTFAVTLSLVLYPDRANHDDQDSSFISALLSSTIFFVLFFGLGILFILQGSMDTQQKKGDGNTKKTAFDSPWGMAVYLFSRLQQGFITMSSKSPTADRRPE